MRSAIAGIVCCLAVANVATAQPHPAHASEPSAGNGAAAFEMIRRMVGEWRAPLGKDTMTAVFRPLAYGTAIQAEEWVGGKQYTVTLFYLVDGELRADHFCDFKNQPRYVARTKTDGKTIAFELRDVTGLDAHPRHFRATTWQFLGPDHVTQDWQVAEKGRDVEMIRLAFTRQRSSSGVAIDAARVKP